MTRMGQAMRWVPATLVVVGLIAWWWFARAPQGSRPTAHPLVSVTVLVRSPDGVPVAGAKVYRGVRHFPIGLVPNGKVLGVTDEGGVLHAKLPPERVCFFATAAKWATGFAKPCWAKVALPEARFEIRMRPPAFVHGVVRYAGKPMAGVRVAETLRRLDTRSAADGSFRFGPLSPGKLRLLATPPAGAPPVPVLAASSTIGLGETRAVDLSAGGDATVVVHVVARLHWSGSLYAEISPTTIPGKPASPGHVSQIVPIEVKDAHGDARFTHVAPGYWRVGAWPALPPGDHGGWATTRTVAGKTTELTLKVQVPMIKH